MFFDQRAFQDVEVAAAVEQSACVPILTSGACTSVALTRRKKCVRKASPCEIGIQ